MNKALATHELIELWKLKAVTEYMMGKSIPRCQFFHILLLRQDQCVLPTVSPQGDCQPNQGPYPQEAENVPIKPGQTNCITTRHSINFSHKHKYHLGSTQYQVAIKIEILGSHCRRTAMVALDTTDSDNAVSTLRNSIRQQKLELPDLVPAQLHAGQVVPLQTISPKLPCQDTNVTKHLCSRLMYSNRKWTE